MKILAIIPARAGSKGIPNKNICEVGGKPLLAWSIEQALNCSMIDRVIVSTDGAEIAKIALKYGAEVPFMRPEALAHDAALTEPVLMHALQTLKDQENYHPDAVMLLQPTSPIRKPGILEKAIQQFRNENLDSLVSVTEIHPFLWINPKMPRALYDIKNRLRRQDISIENKTYEENGSIYITRCQILCSENNRLGGKIGMFEMAADESYDIDTKNDLRIVDALLKELNTL